VSDLAEADPAGSAAADQATARFPSLLRDRSPRCHRDGPAATVLRQVRHPSLLRIIVAAEDLAGRGHQLVPHRRRGQHLHAAAETGRARVLTERDGQVWPGFDEEVIFELGIERVLLMLTQANGPFRAGPTIWKAGDQRGAEAAPSGIVT
jgi:hypothetical protein